MIGVVRHWADHTNNDDPVAGVRTYGLWCMGGFLTAFITEQEKIPYAYPVIMAVFAAAMISGQVLASKVQKIFGFTGITSALVTFMLGSLLFWQQTTIAVVATTAVVLILGLKNWIHKASDGVTNIDVQATLQFLALTGIILPLVPNQGFGPYQAINPFKIWLMVILIAGTNFIGYILMRIFGAKAGSLLTGVIGGLASSTATTLAFSRRSKDLPDAANEFAVSVLLACMIMLIRVWIIIYAFCPPLASELFMGCAIMAVPTLVLCVILTLAKKRQEQDTLTVPVLKNPLRLKAAAEFAGVFALVVLLVQYAQHANLGSGSVYIVSFLSGITDMDAIALSMSESAKDGSAPIVLAANAVILAVLANTLAKNAMAYIIGTRDYANRVTLGLGLTFILGGGYMIYRLAF